MNHLDRHHGTSFASPDMASARRDFRISIARYTATLRKLERAMPEHTPAIERARKSALRLERERLDRNAAGV